MRQSEILGAVLDDLHLHRESSLERDGLEVWTGTYVMNWKLESVTKRHGCGNPTSRDATRAGASARSCAPMRNG